MANYPAGTIKYVISGALPHGTRFAFGFQTKVSGTPSQTQIDAGLGVIASELPTTNFAGVMSLMSVDTNIDSLDAYGYDGGATAVVSGHQAVGNPGTSPNTVMPNQAAVVVSLKTGSAARSGRGRMYIPATGAALTSGQLSAAQCTDLCSAIGALFEGYSQQESGLPQTPIVASKTHGSSRDITQVFVDSRIDIQRHRAQGESVLHSHSQNV